MLLSCWVFTAPTADAAASAGSYTWRVQVNITNDFSCSTSGKNYRFTLNGADTNGTGSSTQRIRKTMSTGLYDDGNHTYYLTNLDNNNNVGVSTNSTSYTTSYFPTYFSHEYYKEGRTGFGNASYNVNLQVWDGSSYVTIASGSASQTGGYGQIDCSGSAGEDKYPKQNSGGAVSFGDSSLTISASGNVTSSVTVATAYDQYGVQMAHSLCSLSRSCTVSTTGISVEQNSSDKAKGTLTVGSNAHILTEGTNSQSVTVTATWSDSNSADNPATSNNITVYDEKYSVAYSYKSTNSSNYNSPSTTNTTQSVYYGEKLNYSPASYHDNDKVYGFSSWSPALAQVTGTGFSYTATYSASSQYKYSVTFTKGDGVDFGVSYNLTNQTWGDTVYNVPAPVKNANDTYRYPFDYWIETDNSNAHTTSEEIKNKKISELKATQFNHLDKTYQAHFDTQYWVYTIKFMDGSGVEMSDYTQQVHYGDTITVPDYSSVTRTSTAQYDFVCLGWSTNGTSATAVNIATGNKPSDLGLNKDNREITYYPYYRSDIRSYDIKFISADTSAANADDSSKKVTETKSTQYGVQPVPTTPSKIATNYWTRTFTGKWISNGTEYNTADIPTVTGGATYEAKYTNEYNYYTINYENGDGSSAGSNDDR